MIKRRDIERWLSSHGFIELPRRSSGHSYWEKDGLRIQLSAHENTVSKGVVAQIIRRLEGLGYDRKELQRELGLRY